MSFAEGQAGEPKEFFRADDSPLERISAEADGAAGSSAAFPSLLLDSALAEIASRDEKSSASDSILSKFLGESSWFEKLVLWLGEDGLRRESLTQTKIIQQLERDIARIDRMLSAQLNAVLHHASFKRLEASWRGLHHLVECKARYGSANVLIQVLNAKWNELEQDQEQASEFDQSQFFKKVYEAEIGTAGYRAFSALLIDHELHPRPSREHPFDDIATIRRLSGTAAAAFAPIFINASPSMLGVDRFDELRQSLNLETLFERKDFAMWRQFRDTADSRFVSVVLPRMMIRRPYRPEEDFAFGFPFNEEIQGREDYVWGGAIFGVGEVLIRNFAESGWFAQIRGMTRGEISGGLVVGPAQESFRTEHHRDAPKAITDLVVSDHFERQLARQGFMTLCACRDSSNAAFFSCPSAQQPQKYTTMEATANAEISSLMNYILCASRFGHYIKLIHRDKIGSGQDADQLQQYLTNWIVQYVANNVDPSESTNSSKPLADASIRVFPRPGYPGEYDCTVALQLIHGFDDVRATLKLDTKLVEPEKGSSTR